MKIYTRTGDKGKTSLFGGKRVSKSSLRVEAYGTIDELNSAIGVAISQMANIQKELLKIQHDLFSIGAVLANPQGKKTQGLEARATDFERLIDQMTEKLSELRNFILPGGGKTGALLHAARTVCRRAERRIVSLAQKEHVDTAILVYLNRLSDLLFTMARYVNMKEEKKETVWVKK